MKLFNCQHCHSPVYFENTVCGVCLNWLGLVPATLKMQSLQPNASPWSISGQRYKYCQNHRYDVCNWLVAEDSNSPFCVACDLNDVIPNLNNADNLQKWGALETAKHQLVYALLQLGLPIKNGREDTLVFDFLAQTEQSTPVITGHANGRITLNISEADPVKRERTRLNMGEPYRTLIGHFRHEVGHYYWQEIFARNPDQLAAYRAVFGDEREDYGASLDRHYAQGAPANWQSNFVSEYATAHPWEDWAESWAHYLHLLDMLETAHSFGISVDPRVMDPSVVQMEPSFDPYQEGDAEKIIQACVPLTLAINTMNRGMGRPDLYPFVISDAVRRKLGFIHRVVKAFTFARDRPAA